MPNDEAELPPSAGTANSSDMFGSDDPSFIAALAEAVLPGDIIDANPPSHSGNSKEEADSSFVEPELTPPPSTQIPRKRRLSDSSFSQPARSDDPPHYSASRPAPRILTTGDGSSYMDDKETYGAAHFGDFGEYMSRKRAKLQLQNVANNDINEEDEAGDEAGREIRKRQIFKGLAIYVCWSF